MAETCFVVMPIGNQRFGEVTHTAEDLRKKYDTQIKEALQKAKPTLAITRADDVSLPGSITNDIFTITM